ncbi:MAG: HTH-type transcriptional regulator BhcR [Pseudomonadota bacterium]
MSMAEKRQRGRPRSFHGPDKTAPMQALDRALAVLKLVSEGDGLSLTEAAEAAGLPPATTYRILTTLQSHGMVTFEETQQTWSVGVEAFRMGSNFLRRRRLPDHGRKVMQALVAETGETANLAVAEEDCVVFVSQVETHQPIRAFFRPGTRGPYHGSGIGKAILAASSDQAINRIISHGLESFTQHTLTNPAALFADLETIRRRGYAIDDEERNLGMRCVAAAIHNEYGEPIGGLSVSGPSVRVTRSAVSVLGPQVKAAADQVTSEIGGSPG